MNSELAMPRGNDKEWPGGLIEHRVYAVFHSKEIQRDIHVLLLKLLTQQNLRMTQHLKQGELICDCKIGADNLPIAVLPGEQDTRSAVDYDGV
jgi:hypothetical protein